MLKYAIWDRKSPVRTPIGEILTPEEWIDRYGWAADPEAVPIVAAGFINGAFSGELHQLVDIYAEQGADFSECESDEDKIAVIEAFEQGAANAQKTENTADPTERIAAALEYQVLTSLDDVPDMAE